MYNSSEPAYNNEILIYDWIDIDDLFECTSGFANSKNVFRLNIRSF